MGGKLRDNSTKSVLLVLLMLSMSLSAGIVEVNRAPWLIEEAPSELEPPIPEPMYSAPADWELIPSESNIEVVENSAISDLTFNWTAWSSGIVNGTSTVYTTGDSGNYNDITIDSNGKAHIVFYREDNTNIYHSTNATSSGNWVTNDIDTSGNVGQYCSIAIDSNDAVHISYFDATNNDLKYATDKSGSWAITTVDTSGDVGRFPSIALDSNDAVHISYYDNTNDDLKYIALDSSSNMYGYSISPSLPAGLSLNAATGEISGTPTALSTNTTYTITVRNSGGTDTTTITIVVEDQVPTLSYSPENLTLTKGQSSSDLPLNATLTGSGTITSWAISPALPSGLTFETSNGTIWGTPTSLMALKTFTIWANNSGGTETTNFTLTVEQPTYISRYPITLIVLNVNQSMAPLHPLFYFDEERIPVWSISPELPDGLVFENGNISGTPTEASNFTNYTITVTGQMVPVELYVTIQVFGEPNLTIVSLRNETNQEASYVIPEVEEKDESFDAFWICPPILVIVAIMLTVSLNRLIGRNEDEEKEDGDEESED